MNKNILNFLFGSYISQMETWWLDDKGVYENSTTTGVRMSKNAYWLQTAACPQH